MEPWDGPACVTFTDGTPDRRGARPQRPAARPLLGHRGRPGRAGQRGRRARPRPGDRRAQGPAAARPDVPRRHRPRAGSSTTTRSRPSSPPSAPYDEWLHAGLIHLDDLPEREHVVHTHASRSRGASRPSATPRRSCASCSRRWPRPAPSRSARWAPTPRSRCSRSGRGCSSTTSPSCSPRSPTRRWTRSARSSSPRSAPRSARSRTCSTATPAHCRQVVLPFPVIDNDELAKIMHINHDGDLPGLRDRAGSAASTRSPAAARRCGDALDEICAEVVRGDRRRRAVHRAVRPRLRRRAGADPVAAADRARCTTT